MKVYRIILISVSILAILSGCGSKEERLIKACQQGQYDTMITLLKEGVNKDFQTEKDGATCLMVAAGNGQTKIVEKMLALRADSMITDKKGNTAVEYATYYKHHEIATMITEYREKLRLEKIAEEERRKNMPINISIQTWVQYRKTYRDNKKTMTELQFDEWWKTYREDILSQYKGKKITTSGYIYEVDEGLLGGLNVKLDIDKDNSFSFSEITLFLDKSQKDEALKLKKGELLTFTGKLKHFDYMLGSMHIHFEDVTW
ncbi:ankyrin repeat domain-containing protein [Candidatus Dojkabacteria bacterium]|nr:ankyrin repeat domain-containing protein [Candidatus Dojkabacteria bacterium]